nr:ATP-dependent DNA helicase [Sedimentibacter sp.]
MENIKLSVRELVEFIYKGGDLNFISMKPERAMDGIKAHKLLQSQMEENYHKEFFLKYEFEYKNISFAIEGRADGIIIDCDNVTIDEIKSTYVNLDMINENYNLAHSAQAKCYAFIYGLQNNLDNISMQLRYYNLDSKQTKCLSYRYTLKELELFFYELIDKYLSWAETLINLHKSRRETINKLEFPFENYRQGQRDFSVAVFRTIKEGKKLFAQAPTGVGKTISVLFPAIKAMNIKQNSKIFYLTAKSSTKTIAFNTMKIMIDSGLNLRTVIITAKEKICFMEECNCDPEFCPYARGYYDKINDVLKKSVKEDCLFDKEYIEKICRENEICPFEYSLDLSYMSDVVICDYNYYFDPRVSLQREDVLKNNNDILLIDEAHNLEDRARSMYSPELLKEDFLNVSKIMKDINKKIYKELRNVNKKFIDIKKNMDEITSIMEEEPLELIKALRKFVVESELYINDIKSDIVPDELMDLYFKSSFFIKISEIFDERFCYYSEFDSEKTLVKIFLIDPSKVLKDSEKNACSSIFFSATLTPLKYFKYLLGGDDTDYSLKIKSPFDETNLKIMITADLSMKYSVRDLNIKKVCDYIHSAVSENEGNYMVFFPSYKFMDKVLMEYKDIYSQDNIVIHNQAINEDEQNDIVNKFHNCNNIILFTVVGGIFSEGIDLPLEKLIGAVIIGTGIPQISFERNIIKDFFSEKFNMGYEFAYKYPGFNKILQSSGRVIRTEKDVGMILLIDSRLCQYSYIKLFPKHWNNHKKVYGLEEFRKENNLFWKEKVLN